MDRVGSQPWLITGTNMFCPVGLPLMRKGVSLLSSGVCSVIVIALPSPPTMWYVMLYPEPIASTTIEICSCSRMTQVPTPTWAQAP